MFGSLSRMQNFVKIDQRGKGCAKTTYFVAVYKRVIICLFFTSTPRKRCAEQLLQLQRRLSRQRKQLVSVQFPVHGISKRLGTKLNDTTNKGHQQ